MTQRRLSAPVKRKAACHPRWVTITGTASGTRIAPTLVPELKRPVASARSLLGNHSATVLIAAGEVPESTSPRKKRETPKAIAERASAWLIAARLQTTMVAA